MDGCGALGTLGAGLGHGHDAPGKGVVGGGGGVGEHVLGEANHALQRPRVDVHRQAAQAEPHALLDAVVDVAEGPRGRVDPMVGKVDKRRRGWMGCAGGEWGGQDMMGSGSRTSLKRATHHPHRFSPNLPFQTPTSMHSQANAQHNATG